jgi:uncharacterized protein (DUF58 family)
MKRAALMFLSLASFAVFLFAPLYPLRFAALFVFLVIIWSYAYREYLSHHIIVRRREKEIRQFRYEWLKEEIILENRGRLPAFMLHLADMPGMLGVTRNNKALVNLKPRSRLIMKWDGYCGERGIFTLGPAKVQGSDPLGLFPFELASGASGGTTRLVVYPALTHFNKALEQGMPLGNIVSPNPLYEDLTRQRSVRDYQSGDEIKRINWKLSARSAKLCVNEYESSFSSPFVVFLNYAAEDFPFVKRSNNMERAIELAAGLCLYAYRAKQVQGLLIYQGRKAEPITIKASAYSFAPVMERLAALERVDEGGKDEADGKNAAEMMFEKGRSLGSGSHYVYVGPEMAEPDYHLLSGLEERQINLNYILLKESGYEFI